MPPETRRAFLATLGAAALGLTTLGSRAQAWEPAIRRPSAPRPIGLQLYTVRAAMARDVPATLAAVAAAGYTEVEFAGYFGHSPAAVRDMLRDAGLTAPSVHVPYDAMADGWDAALDVARTIGHEWMTIPWIPQEVRRTRDDVKRLAERYDAAAARAREAGLRFAHHNHDFELVPLADGTVPLDLLIADTDPALVGFELDVYWMVHAGADPLRYLARVPDRVRMLHLKDSGGPPEHRMLDVGQGIIDFPALLVAAAGAGVEHLFVEHDQPADPMGSIRSSHDYLARLLASGADAPGR